MNQIIQGDCLEVLKTMDSESVDCVIKTKNYVWWNEGTWRQITRMER